MSNAAEGATFPGQDTPDTAGIRAAFSPGTPYHVLITGLCDALDAATARADAAEAELRVIRSRFGGPR